MSVNHNTTNNNDLCSNWWPSLLTSEMEKGMPHPMCRLCANWLPDTKDTKDTKKSGCGNVWSKEKNTKK